MKRIQLTGVRRAAACAATLALALSLAACANPLEGVDLSGVPNPLEMLSVKFDEFFGSTTVEEALESQRAANAVQFSSGTLHTEGQLTVGLSSYSSAPMVTSSVEGKFQGYDVDVASALASQLGLTVSFVEVTDAASAEAAGADVVMNSQVTTTQTLTVVGAYAESATAFFHKGEETVVDKGLISGKTVGVQGNSLSQQLLKRSDLNAREQTFSSLNEAFAALEAGTVDYVLCDALSGAYLQGAYTDIALAGTIDVPSSVGVGVAAANTELQQYVQEAMDKIGGNGVIDVIRAKWLGGMGTLTANSQIKNITLSSSFSTDTTTGETTNVTGTGQDGTGAGGNAADISG